MPTYYGGQPCLDPTEEVLSCLAMAYPVEWRDKVNTFYCPLGPTPGQGRLLMLRGSLSALSPNTQYSLEFRDSTGGVVTLRGLLFTRAYAVVPGARNDPQAAFFVEVEDRRRLARATVIDKAYNIRIGPDFTAFDPSTTNGGTDWTWQTMVADIWDEVGKLDTFPGLPFTPEGAPEGFDFYGGNAYDALNHVLERLSCALEYDPLLDEFHIAQIGGSDPAATLALAAHDQSGEKVFDEYPIEGARGRVPYYVRVCFIRQPPPDEEESISPFYIVDVTDPSGTLSGVEPGTYHILYDEEAALVDSGGSVTNTAALATRAAERGADYFRKVRMDRLSRTYSGSLGDMLPGAQLKEARWYDQGDLRSEAGGVFTKALRYPGLSDGLPVYLTGGGDESPFEPPGGGPPGGPGRPPPPSRPPGGPVIIRPITLPPYLRPPVAGGSAGSKYETYFRRIGDTDAWYFGGHIAGPTYDVDVLASALNSRIVALPFLGTRAGSHIHKIAIWAGSQIDPDGQDAILGIYSNDSDVSLEPDALLADTGVFHIPFAAGALRAQDFDLTLEANKVYWLALSISQPASCLLRGFLADGYWPIAGTTASWAEANTRFGWYSTYPYDGTLPDPWPGTNGFIGYDFMDPSALGVPAIGVRFND